MPPWVDLVGDQSSGRSVRGGLRVVSEHALVEGDRGRSGRSLVEVVGVFFGVFGGP